MTDLLTKCWAQYHALGACKCLSLDCTYKVPLKVVGTHPDDKQSILTAINLYGGIVLAASATAERPATIKNALEHHFPADVLQQIQFIAVDAVSQKLLTEMQQVCPQLEAIALDSLHVCYNIDVLKHGRCVRPAVGGLVLRNIMNKYNMKGAGVDLGDFYYGQAVRPTSREKKLVDMVRQSSMSRGRANHI